WRERFVHVSYWQHQGMIDIIVDLIHGAVVALEWIIRIGVFNSGTASTQSQCGSSKAKTHGFFLSRVGFWGMPKQKRTLILRKRVLTVPNNPGRPPKRRIPWEPEKT